MKGDAAPPSRVAIAIPTYRRPEGLRALLDSIAAQDCPALACVIIADNDPVGQAGLQAARARQSEGFPVPIDVFDEPAKGLSNVRNALVARALSDPDVTHVAMIDDDERADPAWLSELLRVQQCYGADVVGGPVRSLFAPQAPEWLAKSILFNLPNPAEGPVLQLGGTNNVLFLRRALVVGEPMFDPAFNATGGEDMEAFARLAAQGMAFAWADRALVSETVPVERTRLGWIVRRSFRIGTTDMRIQLRWRYRGRGAGRVFAKEAAALLARLVLLPVTRPPIDGVYFLVRAAGKCAALLGARFDEYR